MDKNQQAWQRGVRMASLWKKLKASVLLFDNRCVAWARLKKLPTWVGHLPTILACMLLFACIVMGSALIVFSLALLFSLALIIGQIRHGANDTSLYSSHEDQKNNLCDEFVMDSATNNEYDGAPYKSPSED